MADRTVRVSLQAQVSGYLAGMAKAHKATSDAGTAAEKAARQIEEQTQAMQAAGRGLMAVGVVALAATALSVKAAIGWQSAWTGVTKTVSGTPAELAKVEEGLRNLAKTLPSSHDEIAAVAEAAGQLGIQTGSVVAFTNTMIDLGQTTNLSADEAATSLARFMNIMGTSQGDVARLGSAIVALGNNYAGTEAEIVDMALRLAGAGRQIDLSEGEVLGLATALSSVGIESEAGGTAFSTLMVNIAAEVETGGDKLEDFAKTSGMSAADFSKQWKSDPAAALDAFISGLGGMEEQGGSTLQTLADLGITEIRMRDALLRASSASDIFSEAMQTGNDAVAENNALAAEAAKRYETVESKLQIMGNRVLDAAISFGEVFLPAVAAAAEGVGGMADALGAMDPYVQQLIAIVAVLGGGVALAGGAFLLALPKIAAFQVSLGILATSSMPSVAAAATGMMVATNRAATAMGTTAKFLAGPWGVALLAAGIGVKVLVDHLESLKPTSDEVINAITTSGQAIDGLTSAAERANTRWFSEVKLGVDDVQAALTEANIRQEEFLATRGGANAITDTIEGLREYGNHLGELAQTDLPAAQKALARLADQYGLSGDQVQMLIDMSPTYEAALVQQATKTGQTADKATILKLAMEQTAPVALTAADAYLSAADETAGLTGELTTLIDTLNEANGVGQDAISQNINYQSALADVDAQIAEIAAGTEGYSLGIGANTEAGRTNLGMLNDLAGSSQDAAKAQFDLDGNTADYKTTLEAGRQAVIDRAVALGATADEAQILADKIYAIPTERAFKMIADTANAQRQLDTFFSRNNNRFISAKVTGGQRAIFATGGTVYGPGTGTSDSIPTMLSNGEEVTRASMAEKFRPLLKAINADRVPGYAGGGTVRFATPVQYVQSFPRMQSLSAASSQPISVEVTQSDAPIKLDPSSIESLARTLSGYLRVQSRQGVL